MVAKTLCAGTDLRWNEVLPGRILHVRIMNSTRNIDVLGCYQHVYRQDSAQLHRREQFWQCLESHLQLLPSRNTVAVLGDFNCCLHASQGTCGSSLFHWNQLHTHGTCHSDHARFLQVLRSGGLVALNTWNDHDGSTYVHQQHASRIDFLCTRQQFADGKARQVQHLWQAPFLSPGFHGHVPLVCNIAMYWIPPAQHSQHGLTPHQRMQGREAKLHQRSEWIEYLQRSEWDIWSAMQNAMTSEQPELQDAHDVAKAHFSRIVPAVGRIKQPEPWKLNPITINKWEHRQLAQRVTTHDLKGCFKVWFHVVKFSMLKRQHQRYAAKLRRRRFEETLQLASLAAGKHDTHTQTF